MVPKDRVVVAESGLTVRAELDRRAAAGDAGERLADRAGQLDRVLGHARAQGANATGIGKRQLFGVACGILVHSDQGGNAVTLYKYFAHPVPRRFRRNHPNIRVLRRDDGLVVNGEAVSEYQALASRKVRQDVLAVRLRLGMVGKEHHDDCGERTCVYIYI